MGSFVPAAEAEIGVVDQLFSRVGAADDLARGRSTFMVEMVETAAILNQAGPRALVILDEIGRGTATYDGLSIAWAVLEHLHDVNRCRALFATHYHELTALAAKLPGLRNATVAVREWQGEVVFLHEVIEGAADRSYGVQVARLAGLPAAVVERARVVLEALEKGEREGGGKAQGAGRRPAALRGGGAAGGAGGGGLGGGGAAAGGAAGRALAAGGAGAGLRAEGAARGVMAFGRAVPYGLRLEASVDLGRTRAMPRVARQSAAYGAGVLERVLAASS